MLGKTANGKNILPYSDCISTDYYCYYVQSCLTSPAYFATVLLMLHHEVSSRKNLWRLMK